MMETWAVSRWLCGVLAMAAVAAAGADAAKLPAFPGAEGFGATSVGGRGGRVIKVTNLNSTGRGSLQWACEQKGPRTVVFDVSGIIVAPGKGKNQRITITQPSIYIAGQTAPGAGITIVGKLTAQMPGAYQSRKDEVKHGDYRLHDITIRFVRTRPEKYPPFVTGGRSFEIQFTDRSIIDHCSMAWAVDEELLYFASSEFTVQWCTVEESAIAWEKSGQHNYGLLLGYLHINPLLRDKLGASIHHNLFAHHSERAPLIGVEVTDYRNNVVYNVGEAIQFHPPRFNNRRPGRPIGGNVVANYFKRGPGGPAGRASFLPPTNRATPGITMGASAKGCVFAKDNYFAWAGKYADHDPRIVEVLKKYTPDLIAQRPWPAPRLTTQKAGEAYELVLAHAGCLPRDAVTRRTIEETRAGTGIWGRHDPKGGLMEGLTPAEAPPDADKDGLPDEWEKAHELDPKDPADANRTVPAGASQDDRHSGYTYIEFYINELADKLIRQAIAQAKAVR